MSEILLPQLGETMEEAEIVSWLKAVGEHVDRGEPLLEVETDKIAVEVPALESGVLTEILVEIGRSARVGQAIARMRSDDEQKGTVPTDAEEPVGVQTRHPLETPPVAVDSAAARTEAARGAEVPSPQLQRASPASRALARELGIDLADVSGTGPRGRITSQDVRAARQTASQTATDRPTSDGRVVQANPPTRRTLSRIERTTARTTQASFRDVPHFYVRVRADVTLLMGLLTSLREGGERVTVTDLITLACARTLRRHPRLNASVADDSVVLHPEINIGMITATPDGLVTTVIRRADDLTLQQVHERSEGVRRRLLAGTAQPDDVGGGTFAISNLGMFGVDEFSAIILPPNVAILAVGAVQDDVVVSDGALRFAKLVRLTLSADHRALGGVEAAGFLGDLRGVLEGPESLVADPAVRRRDAATIDHAHQPKASPDRG